jgi:hypothetical protein
MAMEVPVVTTPVVAAGFCVDGREPPPWSSVSTPRRLPTASSDSWLARETRKSVGGRGHGKLFCEELGYLTRRLRCAIERKNELIVANSFRQVDSGWRSRSHQSQQTTHEPSQVVFRLHCAVE